MVPLQPALADESPLSLLAAAQQALESNSDLASQRRALGADRQAVSLARSPLLPQIGLGGRAQIIDSDRADDNRGVSTERAAGFAASVTQVVYDESDWAGWQVQQHTFDAQQQQLESFRLGVVGDVSTAYFELARSTALGSIQERNRELTRANLETTRARVAGGYSSERELLRWQTQLSQNDSDVEQARVAVLTNRFELNRLRRRPREESVEAIPASIEQHGFVYARDGIAKQLVAPERDRQLRNYLVRVGLARSPNLKAIDAAIAAEERALTASKRAFWLPTLSVSAGVDYLAAHSDTSSDLNQLEWGARADLAFPLFEGGAKLASYRQAREIVESLRIERRARVEALDDGIRSAFARASGAYRSVGYAQAGEAAAQKNYEFVHEGFVLGVADYIDLLDAQNQLLMAQLASLNALYDFFAQLLSAEELIAY
jgi:outer membrane protein